MIANWLEKLGVLPSEKKRMAKMAHEIRTPLNAIVGMTDLLAESPLTEEQRQYVKVIQSASLELNQALQECLGPPVPVKNTPSPGAARPLHILLVDDTEDNRLLVVAYLKKEPHRITQASGGPEAIELFQSQIFDLVLMDLNMPGMDGLMTTARMRDFEKQSQRRPVPILALTAHSQSEETEKALAAGCDAHLSKPVSRAALLRALAEHGGRSA